MNVLDEKRSSPELRGYVKERIRKMQDVMARKGVDVTILMRPENVFYFSNFNPILISHVPYFILTRDDAFLLVHCIRHDHAVNEGAVDKVLCYGKWGATQAVAMDAMDAMRELLGGGPLTVGVEGDYASMNFLDRLKTKLQVKGLEIPSTFNFPNTGKSISPFLSTRYPLGICWLEVVFTSRPKPIIGVLKGSADSRSSHDTIIDNKSSV